MLCGMQPALKLETSKTLLRFSMAAADARATVMAEIMADENCIFAVWLLISWKEKLSEFV